jgi:hypothetical protein
MGDKRNSVFDVEQEITALNQLDIEKLTEIGSKNKSTVDPNNVEETARSAGFTSREPTRRKTKKRSPYTVQINLRARDGMKEIFQELGDRLNTYDQETFELALLSLIEKNGFSDTENRYKEITK